MDRREAILQRLVVACAVPGIVFVTRNRVDIPEAKRPAVVILDHDDETIDRFIAGFEQIPPNIVQMSPQIYIIGSATFTANAGTILNDFHDKLIGGIVKDPVLIDICKDGKIEFRGFDTDFATGRFLDFAAEIKFVFKYIDEPFEFPSSEAASSELASSIVSSEPASSEIESSAPSSEVASSEAPSSIVSSEPASSVVSSEPASSEPESSAPSSEYNSSDELARDAASSSDRIAHEHASDAAASDAHLSDLHLSDAELSDRTHSDMHLSDAHQSDRDLSDRNLSDRNLSDRNLSDERASDAHLSDQHLSDAHQSDRDLSDRNLSDAHASDAHASDRHLSDAQLSDRTHSDMHLSDLHQSDRDLSDRNLSDRNLSDRNLSDRNLSDRHASDAHLSDEGLSSDQHSDISAFEAASSSDFFANLRPFFVNAGAVSSNPVSSSTNTPALPSGRVNGNLLIAFQSNANAHTMAVSAGWTLFDVEPTGASNEGAIAYRYVDGNETAPVFTWGGSATANEGIVTQWTHVAEEKPIGRIAQTDAFGQLGNLSLSLNNKRGLSRIIAFSTSPTATNFSTPSGWQSDVVGNVGNVGFNVDSLGADTGNYTQVGQQPSTESHLVLFELYGPFSPSSSDTRDASDAHLSDAQLSDRIHSDQHLSDMRASDAHLSDAQLSDRHLSDAHLSDAHLSDAHLSDAHLSDAHLSDRHLSDAHLSDAHLSDAHLSDAHLSDRHLSDAHLSDAHLSDAHLSDEQLSSDTNAFTAPVFKRVGVVSNSAGAASISPALPTTIADGNFLIAVCETANAKTIAIAGSGWTMLTREPTGAGLQFLAVAYRYIDGSQVAPTFSWTSNSACQAYVMLYSGVAGVQGLNPLGTPAQSTNTGNAGTSITNVQTKSTDVAICGAASSITYTNAGSPDFTQRVHSTIASRPTLDVYDKASAASESFTQAGVPGATVSHLIVVELKSH